MQDSDLTFVISTMTPLEVAEVMLRLLNQVPKDTGAAAVILILAQQVVKTGKPVEGTPEEKIERLEGLLRRCRSFIEEMIPADLLSDIDVELTK